MDDASPLYGIDELAERAGVSRRTVRYYVQQGLLAAPRGFGRGKHYTAAHLETLIRIRTMQEGGTPLALIAKVLGDKARGETSSDTTARDAAAAASSTGADDDKSRGAYAAEAIDEAIDEAIGEAINAAAAAASIGEPTLWTHIQLADDVLLQVRDRLLSEQQRRALVEAVRQILGTRHEQ